jgi:hypothetical protein
MAHDNQWCQCVAEILRYTRQIFIIPVSHLKDHVMNHMYSTSCFYCFTSRSVPWIYFTSVINVRVPTTTSGRV